MFSLEYTILGHPTNPALILSSGKSACLSKACQESLNPSSIGTFVLTLLSPTKAILAISGERD